MLACFQQQKWPSSSLKVTGIAIWQAISDLLLVLFYNYVSILCDS